LAAAAASLHERYVGHCWLSEVCFTLLLTLKQKGNYNSVRTLTTSDLRTRLEPIQKRHLHYITSHIPLFGITFVYLGKTGILKINVYFVIRLLCVRQKHLLLYRIVRM